MDEQVKSRLLKLYRKRQIVDKVLVTDEELHRHYRATHRDRALRLGGIMVETREEAQQVIAALEAGADFQQLARERSLHQDTGEHGGDSGKYKLRDQTRPTIAEKVFHLEIGGISEPVPFSYEGQKGYVVFKVLDAVSVPLESSEQRIREELISWKMATRTQALLDSLREEYAPRIMYHRIPLLSAVDGASLSDSTGKKALCTFKGGQIALADFLQNAQKIRIAPRELADSSRVVALLQSIFIPERLFLQEAKVLGLDQDPELLDFLSRKREELLISLLRQREVDQHTTASDEEAQAFFDAHPEKFTSPETIVVTEILVPSDSLAYRLKRELQEGADATPLAVQHTMREGALHHSGNLRLNVYTQAFYPSIYEAAQHLEVGEVGGPVPTGKGYSVFRVIDRGREKEPYDADTQRRARAYVKIDKAKRGYVHYVRGFTAEILRHLIRGKRGGNAAAGGGVKSLYKCAVGCLVGATSGWSEPLAVQFVDRAADAGLTQRNVSGTDQSYIVEGMMGGAAFFDYDRDGDVDLYVTNGSSFAGFAAGEHPANRLYRNDGGRFADVTVAAGVGDTSWSMGCAVADYDNDGYSDLYVTNFGRNTLYRNSGAGRFADVTVETGVGDRGWGTGASFGDYDRDGDVDLYVANYVDFSLDYESPIPCLWKNVKVYCGPVGLLPAADVFFCNNGDGTFSEWTQQAGLAGEKFYGMSALFGDYDNDGWPDLFVANDSTPNLLFRNGRDGRFAEEALMAGVAYSGEGVTQGCMGTAWGDYDNDGLFDLFVTNFADEYNALYKNEGGGFFADVSFAAGIGAAPAELVSWGTGFFDYDNDGDRDLFVANGHTYPQADLPRVKL